MFKTIYYVYLENLFATYLKPGLQTLSNFIWVQPILASSSSLNLIIYKFEFDKNKLFQVRVHNVYRLQWKGKIITSIYMDCDYLNTNYIS